MINNYLIIEELTFNEAMFLALNAHELTEKDKQNAFQLWNKKFHKYFVEI